MNIKVDRNEFLKALVTVSKATTLRNVGSLEGILLESYDDVLSLYATNKEIQISTIIDAKVIREGKLLINSRILSDIVRSFDNGEVEIDADENNNIKLTCLNSKFNITAMDHRTFPNKEVYNINDFIKMDNHVIRNMVKETSFACATSDSVSPILTGILIENNDEDIKFVAIDGFRMAIRSEQSKERYAKIFGICNEQVPYIGLYYNNDMMAYSTDLMGDVKPNCYSIFYNFSNWYRQ